MFRDGEIDVNRAERNVRDIFGKLIGLLIASALARSCTRQRAVVSVGRIPVLIARRLIKGKVVTRCRLYARIDESTHTLRRNRSTRPTYTRPRIHASGAKWLHSGLTTASVRNTVEWNSFRVSVVLLCAAIGLTIRSLLRVYFYTAFAGSDARRCALARQRYSQYIVNRAYTVVISISVWYSLKCYSS